jgi:hypothetical protein
MQPLRVDTVTFDDGFDYERFARDLVDGNAGVGGSPFDQGWLDWFTRAMPILDGTEALRRLVVAFARVAREPAYAEEALRFFAAYPLVIDLVAAEFAALRAVLGAPEAHGAYASAVGARLGREAPPSPLVTFAKAEALAGRGGALVAGLTWAEPAWMAEHAAAIVKKRPEDALTILYNLERVGESIDDLAVALVPDAMRDTRFKSDYPRFLQGDEVKRRIARALSPVRRPRGAGL